MDGIGIGCGKDVESRITSKRWNPVVATDEDLFPVTHDWRHFISDNQVVAAEEAAAYVVIF